MVLHSEYEMDDDLIIPSLNSRSSRNSRSNLSSSGVCNIYSTASSKQQFDDDDDDDDDDESSQELSCSSSSEASSSHGTFTHNNSDDDDDGDNYNNDGYRFDDDDDAFRSTASETMGGGSGGLGGAANSRRPSFAAPNYTQRETSLVRMSKFTFLVVLLIATGVTAITTYVIFRNDQKQDFQTRFDDFANQIIEVSQINIEHIFSTYETLSLTLTNHAKSTNSKWPFVTYPQFVSQAAVVAQEGNFANFASFVTAIHFVDPEQRHEWEVYTLRNQEWVQRGLEFQSHNNLSAVPQAQSILPYIYEEVKDGAITKTQPAKVSGSFYAPIWQHAPVQPFPRSSNYNSIQLKDFSTSLAAILQTRSTVFSAIQQDLNISGTDIDFAPHSYVITPIFDSEYRDDSAIIVGMLAGTQPWNSFFSNLIPEGINGITLIVENTCNQAYTYEINGPNVTLIGPGDLHDTQYDDFGHVEDVSATLESLDQCLYTFAIYPTKQFEEFYKDNRPITYTVGVIVIFVIMTALFLFYDLIVEKRQVKVLHTANKTLALVTSLFPSNVRDRLLFGSTHEEKTDNGNKVDDMDKEQGTNNGQFVRRKSNSGEIEINSDSGGNDEASGTLARPKNIQASGTNTNNSKPLADLFPSATVMFADIVGFTAWSSVREPTQVFQLLETVYNAFDLIAKRLGVFKVETIGDSYVAVCGLPEPNDDHAVVMCKFARHCLIKMSHIVVQLEAVLGPDTSELGMRFGLHSGPVTAGVLRGDKARFQLFGDTVNTAARMESNGEKGRVQISQETADLLVAKGKHHWMKARATKVHAKGKGELQTYWLDFGMNNNTNNNNNDNASGHSRSGNDKSNNSTNSENGDIGTPASPRKRRSKRGIGVPSSNNKKEINDSDGSDAGTKDTQSNSSNMSVSANNKDSNKSNLSSKDQVSEPWGVKEVPDTQDEKLDRLIEWNVDVLSSLLKKIIAKREGKKKRGSKDKICAYDNSENLVLPAPLKPGATVLDEVQEIIALPSKASKYKRDPETIQLDSDVVGELYDYVHSIASMYRDNPFHSFDHASHVTQSLVKLLSRVVTPGSLTDNTAAMHMKKKGAARLHQYTYGITSDPITQFACAFSALIHDVDHSGLPNSQLVKEGWEIATIYKNQSVAEQNSVDVAWGLLMEPKYQNLRNCIYRDQSELIRFRQLVVNAVMATDIVDKELGALRKNRWEKAFAAKSNNSNGSGSSNDGTNKSDEDKTTKGDTDDEGSLYGSPLVNSQEDMNRKATIVIEHIIQASDIAHTCQHWHVYIKWNERFFHECYKAYLEGHAEKDPSEGWYKGEIGFFDFYIIPLAKKLKECGVFGVSSDEYLNYAKANRQEWEKKGQDIVKGYLERYETRK